MKYSKEDILKLVNEGKSRSDINNILVTEYQSAQANLNSVFKEIKEAEEKELAKKREEDNIRIRACLNSCAYSFLTAINTKYPDYYSDNENVNIIYDMLESTLNDKKSLDYLFKKEVPIFGDLLKELFTI